MEATDNHKTCRNCNAPMALDAKYCSACSQKYSTGRITFGELCGEFFTEYFNLDSKLFKTAAALLIPGKLTNEYFKGRHKTFASPLRLFIVTGVLLFAFVSFQISKTDMEEEDMLEVQEDLGWLELRKRLDAAKVKTDSMFTQSSAIVATDSLIKFTIKGKENIKDSFDLDGKFGGFSLPKISKKDLSEKTPDELVELYAEGWGFWKTLAMRQALKLRNGFGDVVQYFIGKSSFTILLMMPFLALGLKLLYFRREYFYVEHLIFAFHYHAFMFLTILLISLVGPYLEDSELELFIWFSILGIFIYLYLAMLKVYKQGWFKTFLKYFVLLLFYLSLAIAFTIISFLISLILF